MRLVLLPLFLIGVLATIGLASRDELGEIPSPPAVKLVEVGRFKEPVYVASPPSDDRLFVVERPGRIRVLVGGRPLARPFLDISRRVSAAGLEEGLFSVAFAPDYATSGLLYVDYTDLEHRTVIEEFRRSERDPNVADPGSRRRVLLITNPTDRHHGGLVLFGPDGFLYVGQGDGGIFHDLTFPAQRLDTLHGKILRIDPRARGSRPYTSPSDNPFVGRPGRDEIWVYGLRNPWRFGFDPTGALVIGDVGQVRIEEIDVAPRSGLNFGWPCLEGTEPFTPEAPSSAPGSCKGLVPPALELFRSPIADVQPKGVAPTVTRGRPRARLRFTTGEGACSIVVGVVVRDPALPSLAGHQLYGDFCEPSLRSFRLERGQAVDRRLLGVKVFVLSSFGVDAAGRVYATSLSGSVYRLAAP